MISAGRAVFLAALSVYCHAAAPLEWKDGAGFRSAEVHPAGDGKAGFSLIAPKTSGILFSNLLQGDAYLTNAVAHNGSGVAMGDVDQDGWTDIYFCALQGSNQLYRNLGAWRFEELPLGDASCAGQFSTGAAFADVDGDGDPDLLVNGIAAGTRLFLNDGKGHFAEANDSGLSRTNSATSMALADIDGDGDLDLYCAHYIDVMHLADPTTRFALLKKREGGYSVARVNDDASPRWKDQFEVSPEGRVRELPEVHGLYRNDGQGHFRPIQFDRGTYSNDKGEAIPPYRDWGLAAMFRDLNGDGAPDLYVCNDNASPDRFWINSGRGTFRAAAPFALRHTSRSSMGVDFADLNRDGHDDFLVVDMLAREPAKRLTQIVRDHSPPQERESSEGLPRYNRNTLFFGAAGGSYVEAAFMAGVAASDWSWCPAFIDIDLDGYEDLLVTNGFEFDVMDQDSHNLIRQRRPQMTLDQKRRSRQLHPRWPTPNASFRNRGDGTFEPAKWGFEQTAVSYGMALGDLDNDGDLDVVVNNLNAPAGIFRNDTSVARVAICLKGQPPNTAGIGARVALVTGALTQSQEIICGGRYMSTDAPLRVFAALGGPGPTRLEVQWRNGQKSIVTNVTANRVYEVDQTAASTPPVSTPKALAVPFFSDASALLGHFHFESTFDDWSGQPLLPRRLSRIGPGMSWYDVDADGWEDLVVSAGRGGKLAILRNNEGKGFVPLTNAPAAGGDQGPVLGFSDGGGNRRLITAVSNYEMPAGVESQISSCSATNLAQPRTWPAGKASIGPMALADIDRDGDLDLFVGGRFTPGRYPEAASSAVWRNERGDFQSDLLLSEKFKSIGLVSGATFTDFDNDGWPDLALALEWGSLRLFRNDHGRFADATEPLGLALAAGWWTSIATGDFDGDGTLDLVAGNWGRNSPYELYQPCSLGIFYGDFTGRGALDIVEAWQSGTNWFPVRDRTRLSAGAPDLVSRFPTHAAYAKVTVPEILGPSYGKAGLLEAVQLESAVFLNRGTNFQRIALPREAQLSPVFGLGVGDFDGDGIEDLFLGQNFYGGLSDLSREDGGHGLWLRGRGDGTFVTVDPTLSGIRVEGEQRAVALADFNHDGRIDLAVAQNNGATKLYVNQQGRRGLRVVLSGPPGNPDAVGAHVRAIYGSGRRGPSRMISAGSGYWSQDACAQILGLAERPAGIWIRWPGGKEETLQLQGDSRDVRVNFEDGSNRIKEVR